MNGRLNTVIVSVENIRVSRIMLWIAAFLTEISKHSRANIKFIAKNTIKLIISFSNRLNINELGKNNNNPIKIIRKFDFCFFSYILVKKQNDIIISKR